MARPRIPLRRKMSRSYRQTGKRKSVVADYSRRAKPPGYRRSKSGRLYYEARKNRSDKGKTRL